MTKPNLNIQEMNSYGRKSKSGNLLGIEPYLVNDDYASAKNFEKKLDGYLAAARTQGWLTPRTVVVWPEYIGTWLIAANETAAPTLQGLVENVIQAHQQTYNAFYATATEQNKIYAALFRTKAADMAVIYQSVFARLAKKYSVTTVAGSTVLPSPEVVRGKLQMDFNGPLFNVGAVFDKKGVIYPQLVYKAYPTAAELPFTGCAPAGTIPAFDTPIGRLGVLICADSFYPQAYAHLKSQGVDAIAVPSFGHGDLPAWTAIWKGCDGWPNPPDVNPKDVGTITNSDAWLKYSLATRIKETNAKNGVNVFLHGDLWPDLQAGGGVSVVVRKRDVWTREKMTPYATLNNLWL